MDARYLPQGFEEFQIAHIPPEQRKGRLPTDILLNAYPSQVSKRSRVKTARQFIETGWRAVSISKFIVGIRYHTKSSRLYVDFKNGGLGYYHNVPVSIAVEFFTADSHGKFLHSRLKDTFAWVPIRAGK